MDNTFTSNEQQILNTKTLKQAHSNSLTLEVLRTADELDATEEGDAAGQQHGERAELEAALLAGVAGGRVPPGEGPAVALVVDVVEEAVLGNEKGVRLERTLCNKNVETLVIQFFFV